MQIIMMEKLKRIPKVNQPVVDVRDVADAHVNAIERGKNGSRYILSNKECDSFLNFANYLRSDGSFRYYKLPNKEYPKFVIWLMSWFDHRLSYDLPLYGKKFNYDNSKSKDELGVTYRSSRESLVEMANNLISIGYIEDLRN
jgi:nucleoside-diphosphate-sugar epimerase